MDKEGNILKTDPFKEYIMQTEPSKKYKGYAWQTAIGNAGSISKTGGEMYSRAKEVLQN